MARQGIMCRKLKVCAGLVKNEEGRADIVRLAYYSVQGYLEGLPVGKDWIDMNIEVLKDCIDYLMWRVEDIENLNSQLIQGWILTPDMLQTYISDNLDFHVWNCGEDVITEPLLSFLEDPKSSDIHHWGSGRFTN